MTPNVRSNPHALEPMKLCVVVAGTSAQRSRAQLSAGTIVADVQWPDAEQLCPPELPLVRVAADVSLPERWLERLLSVCTVATDHVVSVLCEHAELSPVRPGDSLHASSADIDALCFALAPHTLYIAAYT